MVTELPLRRPDPSARRGRSFSGAARNWGRLWCQGLPIDSAWQPAVAAIFRVGQADHDAHLALGWDVNPQPWQWRWLMRLE